MGGYPHDAITRVDTNGYVRATRSGSEVHELVSRELGEIRRMLGANLSGWNVGRDRDNLDRWRAVAYLESADGEITPLAYASRDCDDEALAALLGELLILSGDLHAVASGANVVPVDAICRPSVVARAS